MLLILRSLTLFSSRLCRSTKYSPAAQRPRARYRQSADQLSRRQRKTGRLCPLERRRKLLKFLGADTILFQPLSQGELILDLSTIIAELKSESEKIGRAIAALIGSAGVSGKGATRKAAPKRQGGITPAGRRRLSLAMKRRWAQRRAKNSAAKAAAPKRRGRLTPAGRKRLSEAMKKRWAERKAKAS